MGVVSLPSCFEELKRELKAFSLRLLSNRAKTGIAEKTARKLRAEDSNINGVSTKAENVKARSDPAARGLNTETATHNSNINAAKEKSGEDVNTATRRIKMRYNLGTTLEAAMLTRGLAISEELQALKQLLSISLRNWNFF